MTLKAAIVGCGNIAGGYDLHSSGDDVLTHAQAYRNNKNFRLVAACDIDSEKLQSFCSQWDIPNGFNNIREMMTEATPDVVSICSPSIVHYDNFKQIIDFPLKAIICEKPMAMSSVDAADMIDQCRTTRTLLAINYSRRWMPHFVSVSDDIRKGTFGEVQAARFLYTKGVFHNASHFINLARFWFGSLDSVEVFSGVPWGVHDVRANFFAQFERCPNVVFQNCNEHWYEVAEMDLICRNKRIEILRGGGAIRKTPIVPHPVLSASGIFSPHVALTEFGSNKAMAHLMQNVIEAIAATEPLAMNAEEALETVRICEQIRFKTKRHRSPACPS